MRAMLTVCLGALWTVSISCGPLRAQPESGAGTVEFVVLDSYGKPLKAFQVEIRRVDQPDSRGPTTLKAAGSIRLPYGEYQVTGEASMHQSFRRRILLFEEKLVVLVGFSFRDPGVAPHVHTALKGRIIGGQVDPGSTLVRAVAVWGTFEKETRVGNDGRFEMKEVPYGEYLILLLRGTELVATQRLVRTLREEEVILDPRSGLRP